MKSTVSVIVAALVGAGSLFGGEPAAPAKNVVAPAEPESPWSITGSAGYLSDYIFRGVDLTPDSDGLGTAELSATFGGFTLGAWYGHMFGEGNLGTVKGTTTVRSTSRSVTFTTRTEVLRGDATAANPEGEIIGTRTVRVPVNSSRSSTRTIRFEEAFSIESYDELDLYLQYSHDLGNINLSIGNVLYLIWSEGEAVGSVDGDVVSRRSFDRDNVVDRAFIAASYSGIPYLTPKLSYYINLYNDNDEVPDWGSYLEFRVSGSIPLIEDRLSIDPYALVSYNFEDRVEVGTGEAYTDWNHWQVGADIPFWITENLYIAGTVAYSQRIADDAGDSDFFWGGGRIGFQF